MKAERVIELAEGEIMRHLKLAQLATACGGEMADVHIDVSVAISCLLEAFRQ